MTTSANQTLHFKGIGGREKIFSIGELIKSDNQQYRVTKVYRQDFERDEEECDAELVSAEEALKIEEQVTQIKAQHQKNKKICDENAQLRKTLLSFFIGTETAYLNARGILPSSLLCQKFQELFLIDNKLTLGNAWYFFYGDALGKWVISCHQNVAGYADLLSEENWEKFMNCVQQLEPVSEEERASLLNCYNWHCVNSDDLLEIGATLEYPCFSGESALSWACKWRVYQVNDELAIFERLASAGILRADATPPKHRYLIYITPVANQ